MENVQKQTGTFRSFDNTKMYYEIRGKGEPIIFIYGIACLINHWHHQISFFSSRNKVINYDLRGHHKSHSDTKNENTSLSSLGKDLLTLIKHLELGSCHVVGHSFGASIILEAYQQDPSAFKTLAFINGFSKNPIKGMFGIDAAEPIFYFIKTQYEKNPHLWNQVWKWTTHNTFTQWFTGLAGGFNLKLTQFKDIEIYTKGVAQIDLGVFIPLMQDMINFNGDSIIRSISIPTLIIGGEKDFVTPQKFQREMAENISKNEYIEVPYGSHCCQLDFPDYVNLKLENHFRSC